MSQNLQFTFFRVSTSQPGVTSDELNKFVNSHRVTHVEKHFHAEGSEGYWSFCLQWQASASEPSSAREPSKIDYKTILSDDQFAIFSKLRERRKLLAEQEGVPIYAVATNEQLATMVRDNVTSKAQLLRIAGFGASKVDRYGDVFLESIRTAESIREAPSVAASPTNSTD